MVSELKTDSRKTDECCHYWIIDIPHGPTSKGVCKFCGAKREFDNYSPDAWWYGNISELIVPDLPDFKTAGSERNV